MNEYAAEVDRINGNVASTYTALSEMGATMPAQQNSDNLPETVRTVTQGGGKTVQTDWNQTDETAPDFLKNKPFGEMMTDIVPETEIVGEDMDGLLFASIPEVADLIDLETESMVESINVTFDGTDYVCNAGAVDGILVYGNQAFLDGEDTGEPFAVINFITGNLYGVLVQDSQSHKIAISCQMPVKIPEKYYDKDASVTVFIDMMSEQPDAALYAYKDAALTTKITLEELRELKKTRVLVNYAYMGVPLNDITFQSICVSSEDIPTGGVYFITADGRILCLHCAEYTPPTT